MKKTIDVTAADVAKAFEKDPAPGLKKFVATASCPAFVTGIYPAPVMGGIDWDHQHEWEDVPQRSSMSYQDQVCKICGIKQMQAAAPMRHSKPGITGGALVAGGFQNLMKEWNKIQKDVKAGDTQLLKEINKGGRS